MADEFRYASQISLRALARLTSFAHDYASELSASDPLQIRTEIWIEISNSLIAATLRAAQTRKSLDEIPEPSPEPIKMIIRGELLGFLDAQPNEVSHV